MRCRPILPGYVFILEKQKTWNRLRSARAIKKAKRLPSPDRHEPRKLVIQVPIALRLYVLKSLEMSSSWAHVAALVCTSSLRRFRWYLNSCTDIMISTAARRQCHALTVPCAVCEVYIHNADVLHKWHECVFFAVAHFHKVQHTFCQLKVQFWLKGFYGNTWSAGVIPLPAVVWSKPLDSIFGHWSVRADPFLSTIRDIRLIAIFKVIVLMHCTLGGGCSDSLPDLSNCRAAELWTWQGKVAWQRAMPLMQFVLIGTHLAQLTLLDDKWTN